jgi:hypothetical protein
MAVTADYETYTFRVPSHRVGRLKERIEALSGKAVKLGMPPFTLDVSGEILVKDREHPGRIETYNDVTLTGGIPILEGWRFIAAIEHDEVMNVVKGFGAQSLIEQQPKLFERLTTCPPKCEHCNVNRNRNTTYLFAEKDNPASQIQVGSSCVADFSGHRDPALILSAAAHWQSVIQELSDPDNEPGGGGGAPLFEMTAVVAAAAAVVRNEGRWVARDEADPLVIATVDSVNYLLSRPKAYTKTVTDGDQRNAQAVVGWLRDDDFDHQNQVYLSNLMALAARKYIDPKNVGLAASAFIAHKRHQERANQKQQERESYNNIKLGEEGERLELTVKVEKIIPIETEFGLSRLHIMRDLDSDARVTWFNSGSSKFMEGDTYVIKGRVKRHSPREGIMQTQLSRVTSPDVKIQDDLIEHSRFDGSIDPKTVTKLQKLIDKAQNPDSRNGEGYTIAAAACRAFSIHGSDYKPLVESAMDNGHDLSIPCPQEKLNAFDFLVTAEAHDLIERALKADPTLAENWDEKQVETFGIESDAVLELLNDYRVDGIMRDSQSALKMA